MLENKTIYLAILNQGWVRPELAQKVTRFTHQNKYNLTIRYPARKPIEHNRNRIVKNFLEKTTCDFLAMIDSDVVPPMSFLDLADFQKDVIGGLCYGLKRNKVMPFALKKITNAKKGQTKGHYEPIEENEGLVEVDAIGTGTMIIKREVLENIEKPFENIYNEEGIKDKGLDLSFCEKAKEKGYKIFCHLDYKCSHWTQSDLKKIYGKVK